MPPKSGVLLLMTTFQCWGPPSLKSYRENQHYLFIVGNHEAEIRLKVVRTLEKLAVTAIVTIDQLRQMRPEGQVESLVDVDATIDGSQENPGQTVGQFFDEVVEVCLISESLKQLTNLFIEDPNN